jgi:hypothetical protein
MDEEINIRVCAGRKVLVTVAGKVDKKYVFVT